MEENNSGVDVYVDPVIEIRAIAQRVMVTGNTDYEPGAFNKILKQLERGEITSDEALRRAHEIEDTRIER